MKSYRCVGQIEDTAEALVIRTESKESTSEVWTQEQYHPQDGGTLALHGVVASFGLGKSEGPVPKGAVSS